MSRADAAETVPEGSFEQLGGWPAILGRIAGGRNLSSLEAAAALREVLEGDATPSQVAAFMFGLRCKGETTEEMTGLLSAMLAVAERVQVPAETHARMVDTCGTGGDRSGTINISTIAALVVAGAGVPVCKHGGRAASSRAGSADVLEALGVEIELGPAGVARCIEEAGIGFCFAPRYHPALRHAAPTRRELGVPTAFNFLGPLANPARVTRQVVGVGDPEMAPKMAGVLASGGATTALVVYGSDGLDELTTTGTSTMLRWEDGRLTTTEVDPAALGLAPAGRGDLMGGDAGTNAALAIRVLGGEKGPRRDIVLLNAAAGLVASGSARELAEGLVIARESIDSGRAGACLGRLVSVSVICSDEGL